MSTPEPDPGPRRSRPKTTAPATIQGVTRLLTLSAMVLANDQDPAVAIDWSLLEEDAVRGTVIAFAVHGDAACAEYTLPWPSRGQLPSAGQSTLKFDLYHALAIELVRASGHNIALGSSEETDTPAENDSFYPRFSNGALRHRSLRRFVCNAAADEDLRKGKDWRVNRVASIEKCNTNRPMKTRDDFFESWLEWCRTREAKGEWRLQISSEHLLVVIRAVLRVADSRVAPRGASRDCRQVAAG